MMTEPVVQVRRQWNDYRIATYRFSDVDGVHWDRMSGGVQQLAPQYFLHGYVDCDAMLDGELAHSCAHGQGPHRIKVCVVKKDNEPQVFKRLVESTGPKPKPIKIKSTRR